MASRLLVAKIYLLYRNDSGKVNLFKQIDF